MKKLSVFIVLFGMLFLEATAFGNNQSVRRAIRGLEEVREDLYHLDSKVGDTNRELESSLHKNTELEEDVYFQCGISASSPLLNEFIVGAPYKMKAKGRSSANTFCTQKMEREWTRVYGNPGNFQLSPSQVLARNKAAQAACSTGISCQAVKCRPNSSGRMVYGGMYCKE